MAKFTVPTRGKYRVMASDAVSISTTSLSGMMYWTAALTPVVHIGSVASTIRPSRGGRGRPARRGGVASVGCGGALRRGTSVVRLPERAKAAYTFVPFEFTVRARGLSPKT